MKDKMWRWWFGLGLLAISGVLFWAHYLVFHDLHHLGIFTLHDLAFLPLEVLIVTLILHTMLEGRERQEMLQKLNMVIGAFFSEVGVELLERLSEFDVDPELLKSKYDVEPDWDDKRLKAAAEDAASRQFALKPDRVRTEELRELMISKRQFLLRLLENQNLLENEGFTQVLWAVFHLGDELQRRDCILEVSDHDLAHLAGDMERAYGTLISEWFEHMRHLKESYPYLYSLGVRANPLDFETGVEVVA